MNRFKLIFARSHNTTHPQRPRSGGARGGDGGEKARVHAGARGLEEEGRASTEKTKRCAPFFVPTHYCSIAAVAVVFFPGELEFLKERGAWAHKRHPQRLRALGHQRRCLRRRRPGPGPAGKTQTHTHAKKTRRGRATIDPEILFVGKPRLSACAAPRKQRPPWPAGVAGAPSLAFDTVVCRPPTWVSGRVARGVGGGAPRGIERKYPPHAARQLTRVFGREAHRFRWGKSGMACGGRGVVAPGVCAGTQDHGWRR